MRRYKFFLILLQLTLIIYSCARSEREVSQHTPSITDLSPSYGDAIVEGSIGDASTLIPMLASDSASFGVASLIYNGLVKYDKDLSIVGDLAESWHISPDGLTITFKLRRGVKWHDGHEFTAEDVLFGYRTIIDPKTPTAYKEDYLQVKKAEVLDKYTFRVTYEKPFAPALTTWGMLPIIPKHLLEGVDITKSELNRKPIGTGPFKFVEWRTADRIVLKANEEYFEGRPYLERYIYRVIPDQATMFLELQAGTVDMMGLTPFQFRRQTEDSFFKNNFQKFRYPVFSYTYLGYNLKDPKFSDRRVRQAISYAIDKKEIIEGVLLGLGRIATGPYVPDTWPYNPHVKDYSYNPTRALELLKEAGWEDRDGDGVLDKDGKPFEFTIMTNAGNSIRERAAQIIQWRLAKIGIRVKIRKIEWAAFINEFINKRRFEAVLLGWQIGIDPDQYDIWHSSKTGEKELNFIGFRNEEVDELLEKGRRTFDREKRRQCYWRIQEILAEEQPYTFLYVPDATPIVHRRFFGIEVAPIGITYNIHKWFVPKGMQKYSLAP